MHEYTQTSNILYLQKPLTRGKCGFSLTHKHTHPPTHTHTHTPTPTLAASDGGEKISAGGRSHQWVQKASLVDSRTNVTDLKFAPKYRGLLLVRCSNNHHYH